MSYIKDSQEMLNLLIGETLIEVRKFNSSGYPDNKELNPSTLVLVCESGNKFEFSHSRDCCEDVHLEEGLSELESMIGEKILSAEVSSNTDDNDGVYEDGIKTKWTYYKLTSAKGYCDLRWIGTTHSDYSLEVTIVQTVKALPLSILEGKTLYTTEFDSIEDLLQICCDTGKYSFTSFNNYMELKNVKVDYLNKSEDTSNCYTEDEDFMEGVWIQEKINKVSLVPSEEVTILKLELETQIMSFNIKNCDNSKFVLTENKKES